MDNAPCSTVHFFRNNHLLFFYDFETMRYLPAINLADGIWQIALPDVHAMVLMESIWISDISERRKAMTKLLLSSPQILTWVSIHFADSQRLKEKPISGFTSFELEDQLFAIVTENASSLIRDNENQLSSIQRIEFEKFDKAAYFFSIRDDRSASFCHKVISRLAVVETLLFPTLQNPLTCKLQSIVDESVDSDLVLRDLHATNFETATELETISSEWNQNLPFFLNGLGALDARLKRIDQLESDFQAEVEKEKIAAMRQLAYGASHEVNNPLANISTRAQALLRDETDPKRRDRLMTIDAQAFRAHDMISNLMKFARPPRPQFTREQLAPVVEKVLIRLTELARIQETEIAIEVDTAIYFDVDKTQLEEVLFEVIQNAMEALRRGGKVRVKADWNSGVPPLMINVMDDGPGISNEVRRHIFDPFFSGREAGRGLGFGLSKAWRLMELHGGTIRIKDTDHGANIELQFPISQIVTAEPGVEMTA